MDAREERGRAGRALGLDLTNRTKEPIMISKEAALALTEELISSWVKFNDNLATVCREEAWKPLGFRNLPAYLSHYYPGADISIISSRVEIIWSSDDATEDEIIDCVEHGITRAASDLWALEPITSL